MDEISFDFITLSDFYHPLDDDEAAVAESKTDKSSCERRRDPAADSGGGGDGSGGGGSSDYDYLPPMDCNPPLLPSDCQLRRIDILEINDGAPTLVQSIANVSWYSLQTLTTTLLRAAISCDHHGLYYYTIHRGGSAGEAPPTQHRKLILSRAYAEYGSLRVLLEKRAHSAASLALYRETVARIAHVRSFDGGISEEVSEDLPLSRQLLLSSGVSEFVWHDHARCAHIVSSYLAGGDCDDWCFHCTAALNSEWLDVPADSIRFADPERLVPMLAAPCFFLYTAMQQLGQPCRLRCPWHLWAHAHKYWLRRMISPQRDGADDAGVLLYREVCLNGFFTCGVYRVNLCEESILAPAAVEQRTTLADGHCAFLVFESRALLALLWLRDQDAWRDRWRLCRRYPYHLITIERRELYALILRVQNRSGGGGLARRDESAATTLTIRHTNPSVISNIRQNLRWILLVPQSR